MSAALYGTVIEQGSAFTRVFTLKDIDGNPVDLTGAVAQWSVKESADIIGTLLLNYKSSSQESHITLGGAAGTITLNLSQSETEALSWTDAVYDIFVTFSNGKRYRILYGGISVTQTVTHI